MVKCVFSWLGIGIRCVWDLSSYANFPQHLEVKGCLYQGERIRTATLIKVKLSTVEHVGGSCIYCSSRAA